MGIAYLYCMHVFYQPGMPQEQWLPEEESRHCVKVLRHKAGDPIWVTNGRNQLFSCQLNDANPTKCSFSILEEKPQPKRLHSIHLAIAPTKNSDRLEWMLEKCVELGIDRISLLQCQHSERVKFNVDRLQKKAISAMKQSLNLQLPGITDVRAFPAFVKEAAAGEEHLYIGYVDDAPRPHLFRAAAREAAVCMLVGPEGDFSGEEIELALGAGFAPVSLGPSRLRTETAGLAACHILNLVNQL